MTSKESLWYKEIPLCVASSPLVCLVRPLQCETREHMVAFSPAGPRQHPAPTSCRTAGEFWLLWGRAIWQCCRPGIVMSYSETLGMKDSQLEMFERFALKWEHCSFSKILSLKGKTGKHTPASLQPALGESPTAAGGGGLQPARTLSVPFCLLSPLRHIRFPLPCISLLPSVQLSTWSVRGTGSTSETPRCLGDPYQLQR